MADFENKDISIIVVDDSDYTRRNIVSFLRTQNYNVTADFSHARPALEYLASHNTNIAIIDVVMPEVSGIELAQKITANINRTKVIMMSILSQERIIMEAIAAGAQDFLAKPVNLDHLNDLVRRIATLMKT